ncbi:hypothetical protein KHW15_00160 [Pseudomonas syringae]|uniref:hypothetical protein n=1 Tax=Pseudomonas syringae group TaxID=136849 RepID=UPI00128F71E4|nr:MULTISPECIES: hypothetical protein [Pseudomonas syringae group]MBS7422748.1 hypothetical protein [Pseudomonas syringae]MBS7434485.1 hypothetical protein [Pseudomonas syringae]QVI80568.1 hypothetical protein KHW15_00160 [Pseudomonas syringae]
MSDLRATISSGNHKGKMLYPHLHKDGKYVASPTRFEIDYIRVDNLDELEVLVRSGYAARMSNPEISNAPSLIVGKNILLTINGAVLTPAELLPYIIDQADLDRDCISKARKEQAFLRAHLLRGSVTGRCVICNHIFPVDMLVAAHLKMRSACKTSERKDIDNVVALMCKTGCDDLYERGYISVDSGRVVSTKAKTATARLGEVIASIEGLAVTNWAASAYYYNWHLEKTAR